MPLTSLTIQYITDEEMVTSSCWNSHVYTHVQHPSISKNFYWGMGGGWSMLSLLEPINFFQISHLFIHLYSYFVGFLWLLFSNSMESLQWCQVHHFTYLVNSIWCLFFCLEAL